MTRDTDTKAPDCSRVQQGSRAPAALYTEAERARRDASPWTLVQGLLAPVQFLVCLVSIVLIARFLLTGEGLVAANVSIVVKTLALYAIMITGAIWEKDVFGQYLFAPAFFWEDVVSFAVLALHTAYLLAYFQSLLGPSALMTLALAAYATYAVNAAQFLWKLRQARRQASGRAAGDMASGAAAGPLAGGAA
ncbi:2-vinyl bacteriochlorophyllide hydratase [Stappia stellulata]|uniref:2-vinyl bacteriochlorophyllide hydratase n=1 Tax=Stappia stellulata TaxID=71235 RepID=UPI0004036539|nr:2-vinyl bacteriochlorophyllide hydratase [Stappia stellulata]